jgi:hypothetical protein
MRGAHLCVQVPLQQYERLKARDGDTEMRFDGQCALKELIVLGPFAWKEFLGRNWAIGGGLETIVDDGGLVIELAQGTKSEDEIHAANITRVVLDIFHVVE